MLTSSWLSVFVPIGTGDSYSVPMSGAHHADKDTQRAIEDRLRKIVAAVSEGTGTAREPAMTKIAKWLEKSTPQQIADLDEALESFDSLSGQEKFVIGSTLEPLTYLSGLTGLIHETLALREAFSSPWAVSARPGVAVGNYDAYVLGLRFEGEDKAPTKYGDEKVKRETVALLRFAFELNKRTPYGAAYNPVREVRAGVDRFAFVYSSEELKEFVRAHADRVGELINLALDHQTCDPQRLKILLEYGGPQPVASGVL